MQTHPWAKPKRPRVTWANRITIVRLLLTPVRIILLSRANSLCRFIFFLLAALSADILDGAKCPLAQRTERYLENSRPRNDKLLLSSSF